MQCLNNTCILNTNNIITQNDYNFVTMATKQWNPQQIDKNDIFKPKYFLTTNKYMNWVYGVLLLFLFIYLFILFIFFFSSPEPKAHKVSL